MSSTDSSDTSDPDSSDLRQATSVGARRLFDRMPPGIDCIGALPEGILHHILSFLPAQEAVRTCVLAQRWRHLWKCTTGLRIVGNKGPVSVQLLRKFMDHLLILRERTDLDTVGIEFRKFREDDVPFVNLWIRFALQSKVRALTVCHYDDCNQPFNLDGLPFVSPCLRTLVLSGVGLQGALLDFSSCPALEDLTIGFSVINVGKISSLSLKCLSIFRCRSYLDDRVRVSAPCLVSLKLLGFSGVTPLLESMPLLETAFLTLGAHGHLTSQDIC
uniref:F-box domain-containing protein n=2 Tax=Aegilops tauschii subsp. strangulata TaxID=200361 RepID=A0A453HKG5_AEGTS